MKRSVWWWVAVVGSLAATGAGCSNKREGGAAERAEVLTIYCGRTEALVRPLIEEFQRQTGIETRVNYADNGQLAATVLEEGGKSPADVFFAQDSSTIGLLEAQGRLAPLADDTLSRVDPRFRSAKGQWVGTSGRARVLAYHPDLVQASELPRGVKDLTDPRWKGRLGWAPTNASFQSFVSAMIQLEGEAATRAWLEAMKENAPREYPSNAPAVAAVAQGEVDAVLTNHYYLFRLKAERGAQFPVVNHYFEAEDASALVNVSAVAVLDSAPNPEAAAKFVSFLLQEGAQRHFAEQTHELPLAAGVKASGALPAPEALRAPKVDLTQLEGLQSTVALLRSTGVLR